MTKFFTLLIALFFMVSTPAFANHENAHKPVVVHINGLICDFCSRSLEKLFKARDEVSDIKVDLTAKTTTIELKAGKDIDDATIKQLITSAGYDVVKIDRE